MKNAFLSTLSAAVILAGVGITADTASGGAKVVGEKAIDYKNEQWIPVDDDGVFYYQASAAEQKDAPPMPVADVNLKERYPDGNTPDPVRLKLVQYIDCTTTDHGFNETPATPDHKRNSPSRVLNINGTDYRVTGQPEGGFDLFWYSYRIKAGGDAGQPHLLVVEMPNDIERYTSISMRMPDGAVWLAPHAGAEQKRPNCQSGDCDKPGLGLTVYTGREFPTDGKAYLTSYIFYPRSAETILHIASSGWYKEKPVEAGAAVSKIWVFQIGDTLRKHAAPIAAPAETPERNIGIYMTHPWYLIGHYGIPAHKLEDRKRALTLMADQLALSGLNWIEFNAVNGSDRSGACWYPSKYFNQLGANLLEELPPIAEERGIQLIPIITSLIVPGHQGELPADGSPNADGFSKDSFLYLADGRNYATAFGSRNANPLRPEVQERLINVFREIAEQSKDKAAIKGLGFRVNGKIGLCFTSFEPGATGAKQVGYGPWTLSEFKNDTGSAVPTEPGQAYDWLRARPEEWDKWIDWRCQRTRDFWLRLRDVIREYRPDWTLYVKTVLPSELPGTNIEWVEEKIPAVELLRHHGYDPRFMSTTRASSSNRR